MPWGLIIREVVYQRWEQQPAMDPNLEIVEIGSEVQVMWRRIGPGSFVPLGNNDNPFLTGLNMPPPDQT